MDIIIKHARRHRFSSMRASFGYEKYRLVETSKSEWQQNKHSTGHNKEKKVEKYAIRLRDGILGA